MSYLVLARKYRPSTFSEVVGQEHVTRTLANAFASGRVHHAFLFCGPRGCGKTTLARIVGKALNCERGQAEGGRATAEPCGVCSACTSIGNGSAVDYQEMDGASNRGIDAIRELTEAVRYQPAVLRKKVYVIDEVHMLTTEAFNALLKTLEEPPPHVTFVLATTEPHKLPNTILSRCQRYDFKLVPASRLAQHLSNIFAAEQLVVDANAISLLVRESGGSVRDALSLCDQLISYVGDTAITEQHVAEVLGVADRSLTRSLVTALASGDAGSALASVESAIERGVDEIQLARAIVRYLRDLSVLQVAPDRLELVDASDEERIELRSEAQQLDRSRVSQMFDRMLRCCDELGKTLQPRLVLDCALIDVATVEPLVPLGDLIDRLSELEGRLVQPNAPRAPRPSVSRDVAPRAPAPAPRPAMIAGAPRTESHAGGGRSTSAGDPVVVPAEPARPAQGAASFAKGTVPGAGQRPPATTARDAGADKDSSKSRPAAPKRGGKQELATGTAAGAQTADTATAIAAATAARDAALAASRGEAAASAEPVPTTASMQPSGPVPTAATVASGSGPHAETKLTIPTTADEAMRAWNDVLGELEARRKFSLLGPFQHARVMKWTPEELDLGFPVDVHSMGEMAGDRQHVEELRAIIAELGLPKLRVGVRLLDAAESGQSGARSVLEATRERSSAERHKREAEAREHPLTKHVLQTFGAQIKEIKTDV
ncbi:MAG TPA: DNA polymerase III subunit gamma/tau [Kofleriaceae bacterium]|nr:DNA polymerase III subunit gamma/tau [Kofleriaceae bacterium]